LCSKSSSSPPPSDVDWLIVGRVGKPHGVHGDVLVEIDTDFPERLQDDVEFGLGEESGPVESHRVFRVRYHKHCWLLSVQGIRDRNSVESWRGRYIFLPKLAREDLPEGFFYQHELVGLTAVTTSGESCGEITEVLPEGGQTRLVVRRGGVEFLVPYVPEIVVRVDLDAGNIVLDPPLGLLDDNAVVAD